MAATKTLKTRIQLKYDTWTNWTEQDPVLLNGEIAICNIPAETNSGANGSLHEPAIMFKVGDGGKKYSQLPFAQAVAADVPEWAKKSSLAIDDVDGLKKSIDDEITEQIGKQVTDKDTKFQLSVDEDGKTIKLMATDGTGTEYTVASGTADVISALKHTGEYVEGSFVEKVEQADGKVTVTYKKIASSDIEGLDTKLAQIETNKTDIATLKGTDEVEGSVAKQIKDAVTPVSTKADANEKAIETLNGEDSVSGSVAQKIKTAVDGLTTEIGKFTIEKSEGSGDYAAVYKLTKGDGTAIGQPINIPKDKFVKDATIVNMNQEEIPGTYIKITFQNDDDTTLYIDVAKLVDQVKVTATETIEGSAEDGHTLTLNVKSGSIGETQLAEDINTKLADIANKANDADLKDIAKSGKVNDLIQDEGTWLVLNCGDASTLVDPAV